MTDEPQELFAAVDSLLAAVDDGSVLPPPAARVALREAAGLTQAAIAQALGVRVPSVQAWEAGRAEPRGERLQAYQRLLEGLARRYPSPGTAPAGVPPASGAGGAAPAAPIAPAERPAIVRVLAPLASGPAVSGSVPQPAAAGASAAAPARLVSCAASPRGTGTTMPATTPASTLASTSATTPASVPASAPATTSASVPASMPATTPVSTPVAMPGASERRFPHGPLAVLDGDGAAYAAGGLVLECPATTLAQLVTWTLSQSGLGSPRLHKFGRDGDPLIVLTAAAAERFGLPAALRDQDVYPGKRLPAHHVDVAQRAQRLPQDHKVVRALERSKWQLTRRGFGPWARVYRPVADGNQRQCVQFAVLPWGALDSRSWAQAADLPAPELARVLGVYAARVATPRGSTAVTGLELMTALRPPTRPVKDEATGAWVSAPNPGALFAAVDPAPPEAPLEHPVARGWAGGFIDEEAYQWVRPVETLDDAELMLPWCVGLDINTAFLAAASRLNVGLGAPEHLNRPVFDKKVPGTWLVDLSHVEVDPRLPNPFTPTGQRPNGPGWYATATIAYAAELGVDIAPIEAYVRPQYGAYLDPWHDRLRDAYVTLMADAGIPVGKDTDERAFLAALAAHHILKRPQADTNTLRHALGEAGLTDLQQLPDDRLLALAHRHRQIAMVLSAIKATVKGGIGKLRERPRGLGIKDGERWTALDRPTWRPDIRAAVIAKARVNMHRKMRKMAQATGRYPLGVATDCVVYASPAPDPLAFLPLDGNGHVLPGVFRLGATPGLAKVEGVQTMLWAVGLLENDPTPLNPARHIKGDTDATQDEGE